jgi:hypothetical protein
MRHSIGYEPSSRSKTETLRAILSDVVLVGSIRLDTVESYAAMQSWANTIADSLRGQTVAIDGRPLQMTP